MRKKPEFEVLAGAAAPASTSNSVPFPTNLSSYLYFTEKFCLNQIEGLTIFTKPFSTQGVIGKNGCYGLPEVPGMIVNIEMG
jgi:hypothetical protein